MHKSTLITFKKYKKTYKITFKKIVIMVIFMYLKTQAPKLHITRKMLGSNLNVNDTIFDEDENALNLQTTKKRQK